MSKHDKISFLPAILFALFCFLPAVSQTNPPAAQNFHQWGAVTLFNGLPSDNVRAIAQTPDGVLWFGTDNGLARFDGRRVHRVAPESFPAGAVLTLETDSQGSIWIGTESGAGMFLRGSFAFIPETIGKPITAILPGEIGTLISPDTIFKFHHNSDEEIARAPQNWLDVHAHAAGNRQFTDVEWAFRGNLVFGSRGHGLLIEENGEIVETRRPPYFVNVLESDKNGNLWFGARARETESGLYFASDVSRPARVGENLGTVSAIAEGADGDVWIGTEKRGLFRFRGTQQLAHFTFENTAGGLRSNTVFAVFADREGVLWVGTSRGVSRFDAASPFTQILSENANSNFVRTLFRARDGQIFAGTNRGLFVFAEENWLETENFSPDAIYAVGEDSANQLVVGTPNGLAGYDGKAKLTGDIRAVADFRGKTYAAVFGDGVLQIENQTPIFADRAPTALFTDGEKLWIGTAADGVVFFDGREIRRENALEDLRGTAIQAFAKGVENDLWFGSERGLFRYQNGELQNVIPNRNVRDLALSGADVWAATLRGGLVHARFDENFGWLTAVLGAEQGLPSEQVFAVLPLKNRLLIGTNRGVVTYAPSAIAPQIVVTRVLSRRLHDAEELYDTINLEYPQNSLLLEVSGLSSRTFPEEFQYGFLLKNSGGAIVEKKLSNEAQYAPTNLPAGEYTVEARVFNKDLLVSEPLTVRFSIAQAPFPRTATALGILLAIALVGLIWATIERRRIKQKNRELAAARLDLAHEAERERKRIARDLHDQTLADLRALMLMSDRLPADASGFRAEIESVSTEVRRICEDLSPSVLENVGLSAALEFLLSHTVENYKFSAAPDLEERLHFSPNMQMQIYRIAQEILTNIKRHSNATFVEMKTDISESGDFVLGIENDGATFDPAAGKSAGRGIANIKSRAALIKAEIEWRARADGGTLFQLKKKV